MIRFFGKRLPHKELIDTHVSFVRENMMKNDQISQHSFVVPPYTSEVFSLSYLQSVLFADILAKRSRQSGHSTSVTFATHISGTTQEQDYHLLSKEMQAKKIDGQTMMDCLGCSFDHSHDSIAYTQQVSNTIKEFFERNYLSYDLGVRYWSIDGQTVVSDSQLNHKTKQGKRYFIKFFVDSKKHTVTATLDDPLLLFSAAAIAVSPFDKRYKKFVGKKVIVPIVNRVIPLIVDARVDMAQDTGAVILCPAHNREHFAIAQDNEIPCDVYAIDRNGYFTEFAGEFANKYAYDFRSNVVQYLTDISNLDRIENVQQSHYEDKYNPDHMLLPLATQQWFFSYVNQHLTDSLQTFVEGVQDESLLQEYFKEDAICVSKYLKGGRRFPVLLDDGAFVSFITSQDFFEKYQEVHSQKYIIPSHIALLAMLEGKLSDTFTLEEYVVHLHQFDEGANDYVINLYHKVLSTFYAGQDTIIAQLNEFVETVRKALDDTTLFDAISYQLDNAFVLMNDEQEDHFFFDWSDAGMSNTTSLTLHTIDVGFLSAIDYLIAHDTSSHINTLLAFPRTQLSWSKYLVGPELYRSQQTQTYCFEKNKSLLLTKNFIAKRLDKWGTDASRACILGTNISYDAEIEQGSAELYERFIGKFWNATRYVAKSLLGEENISLDLHTLEKTLAESHDQFSDFDLWILLKVNHLIDEVAYHFQRKELSNALALLTHSIRYDFCDCYLEVIKKQRSSMTNHVLLYALGVYMQLLYPFFPVATYGLWKLVGFQKSIADTLQQGVQGLEKNYRFSMLMDIVAKWNQLHLQNRSQHLYDDLVLCIQSNRDFLEYTREYEDFICTMVGAKEIMYINEQETLSQDRFTDTVVNITLGVRYRQKVHQKQELPGLQETLSNKQQLLQNIRSIISSVDAQSNEYADYIQQIDDLKATIEDIEYDISKIRYGL